MTHPSAHKLDALAAGDTDAPTRAHVAGCEACTAYVVKLAAEAEAFRASTDAAAFAAAVVRRVDESPRPRRLGTVTWVAFAAAPALAAAAVLAVWIRGGGAPVTPHDPGRDGVTPVASAGGGGLHFKGGLSVVAIRERAGIQERLSGPFEVAPSDRVRLEIALDRDAPVVAGLLTDDGTWTPLLVPTELTAGTHFSELAARFDDSPTDAVLLVGAPDDVTRARTTRRFDGVVAWRIRSQRAE